MAACNALFSGSCGAWRFEASEMSLGLEDADGLSSVVEEALRIKRQKALEEDSTALSSLLKDYNALPSEHAESVDADDAVGLLGEAASEMHHVKCRKHTPFYIKWRDTGTSKSSGIDLIFEHAGRLVAVECKHPHASVSRSGYKASTMLRAIRRGLWSHNDARTCTFLTRLYERYLRQKRLLDAGREDSSRVAGRMATIKRCLMEDGVCEEVVLVADKTHALGADHAAFMSRLRLGQFLTRSNRVSALLLFVAGLHEITENAKHAA